MKTERNKSKGPADKQAINNLIAAMEKSNTRSIKAKIEEVARGDLRYILEQVGDVDCLVLLETKKDLKKLLSLPGFSQWCKDKIQLCIYLMERK